MNRLKLWVFALLVIALAGSALYVLTVDLRNQSIATLDARLDAAAARVASAQRALAAELTAVAGVAARDPRLAASVDGLSAYPTPSGRSRSRVPAPRQDPGAEDAAIGDLASAAVEGAESALGITLPGRIVIGVSREGFERRPSDGTDAEALAVLKDALVERKVRSGWLRMQGKLAYGVALPAGERGALAVFMPLDGNWARAATAGSRTTLLVVAPDVTRFGTATDGAEALVRAATTNVPADAGQLAPVELTFGGVKLPAVGPIGARFPSDRVIAIPIPGVTNGRMVLAASARPFLAPIVRLHWAGVAGTLLVLVLALLFGVLVKPTELAAPVPPELVEAAGKIERGDFAARAPMLAGKVGTVAAALNRAAEAAQASAGRAEPSSEQVPSLTQEFFAKGAPPAADPAADAFEIPARPPRASSPLPPEAKIVSDTARLDGGGNGSALSGAAFEAAPVPAPRPASAPPSAPAPAPAAAPADLLQAAASHAPPAAASDEDHWREVFRDFVRVRQECGESAEGLSYERFRQKLETNKAALATKYGCRTVRFQVYVKEGKAALKATPVR
jgi:hypothetical protein